MATVNPKRKLINVLCKKRINSTFTRKNNDNLVQCYDHSHAFVNLPLTLKDTNEEVRQAAKELNSGEERSVAEPQHNEYKG